MIRIDTHAAAKYMREHGIAERVWIREKDGSCCLVGAVIATHRSDLDVLGISVADEAELSRRMGIRSEVINYLDRQLLKMRGLSMGVLTWSDEHATTEQAASFLDSVEPFEI